MGGLKLNLSFTQYIVTRQATCLAPVLKMLDRINLNAAVTVFGTVTSILN
jgi:hypothetical protein